MSEQSESKGGEKMKKNYTFTSESVCAGHPDKICDQISDAIVDEAYRISDDKKKVRVAVETLVTTDKVVMAGEVTCDKNIDYEGIARNKIKELGYVDPSYGFCDQADIQVFIHRQSPDIAQGVDTDGAGDQGMMFGYACNDTEELMPLPITLSHRMAEKIDVVREKKIFNYLKPDGKVEVTILYENNLPKAVERLVLAVPHEEKIEKDKLVHDLYLQVVSPVLEKYHFSFPEEEMVVNGTGKWNLGGPAADTGVTGRKIIVDTYGGIARHGGGCFSGKDLTKVDRSGAYMCRYVAKNLVAKGLAKKLEIRVAYVIGQPKPIDIGFETFGTEQVNLKIIGKEIKNNFDFSVRNILDSLNLQRPIPYQKTARYGHFGHKEYPWEKIVT